MKSLLNLQVGDICYFDTFVMASTALDCDIFAYMAVSTLRLCNCGELWMLGRTNNYFMLFSIKTYLNNQMEEKRRNN